MLLLVKAAPARPFGAVLWDAPGWHRPPRAVMGERRAVYSRWHSDGLIYC